MSDEKVPDNDIYVEFTSADCVTLAFWTKIDECYTKWQDVKKAFADPDAWFHEYDARLYWKKTIAGEGKNRSRTGKKTFGEFSKEVQSEWTTYDTEDDAEEWNPKGATLVYELAGEWSDEEQFMSSLNEEQQQQEDPVRRVQNAVWVKRMKASADANIYEKIS